MTSTMTAVLLVLGLGSCAIPGARSSPPEEWNEPRVPRAMIQGMLGATDLSRDPLAAYEEPDGLQVHGSGTLFLLGAAGQFPQWGDRMQLGGECGFTVGRDAHRDTVKVHSSRAAVLAVHENDLVLGDLFAGAMVAIYPGSKLRLYGGAGPMIQYGRVDLEYEDVDGALIEIDNSGFGTGLYARTGIELLFAPDTWVGFQVRWIESDVDFGGGIGDFDLEAVQYMLSVSRGL